MASRPTLSSLLRRERAAVVAEFVAAVYEARGSETSTTGGTTVVDGKRYVVVPAGVVSRVRTRFRGKRTGADAVVAVDASRAAAVEAAFDAPAVTPADLDDVLRYGLDREVADALVRDWFDRSLDDIAPRAHSRPGATPASAGQSERHGGAFAATQSSGPDATPLFSRPLSLGLLLAFVVVLAVAAPVTLGVGVPGVGVDESTATPTSGTGSGAGADEAGVANEPRPTARATDDDTVSLAPGLTSDGVLDAERLAASHAAVAANRSYTWTLTYIEFVNDTESGRAVERVTAESPGVYASRVETDGFLSSRGPIPFRSSYADGTNRYEQSVRGYDTESVSRWGALGRQERRAQQYYGVLLDGAETQYLRPIPHGSPRYAVEIQGAQTRAVRNYTATAHITPEGFVTYYSGTYCFASGSSDADGTCLSLTMQYTQVNETTVEPPAWYTENGSATSNSTPTPTSTTLPTTSTPPPT